ncbi:MAG TPA: hypothetical protein VNW46_08270 [Gemmatimonadaceae bacterium]|nr:hypothetical protein [Gemmatimonadaceae bacterium]
MRLRPTLTRLATLLATAATLAATTASCSNPTSPAPSNDCGTGVMAGSGNHC